MIKPRKVLAVPVYPFLVALIPAVNLYARNYVALGADDMVRPVVFSLLLAVLAVTVSRIIGGSARRGAMLGGVLVLSVMAYGFAYFLVNEFAGTEVSAQAFLAAWLILTAVVYVSLLVFFRHMRGSLQDITIVLNVFSLVIILAAIVPVILAEPTGRTGELTGEAAAGLDHEWLVSGNGNPDLTHKPDVYFLALDAYARGDVLQSRFSYDNSRFLSWLEAEGFFVADKSHANYPWTHLSLASTFNSEYLDTLVPTFIDFIAPPEGSIRFLFFKGILANDFVKVSRVPRFFAELGYRIVSNDTGFSMSAVSKVSSGPGFLDAPSQFEEVLIGQTLVQPLMPALRKLSALKDLDLSDYDRVTGALEALESAAGEPGPKFVFHHIVSPHEPFCFDENGARLEPHPLYDSSQLIKDKVEMPGYEDWFTESYPANVAGLNIHLKQSLQAIMETTGGNAVIIVQSDHGSHAGFNPDSVAATDIPERFGILNAIYLPPGVPRDGLAPGMSSINTFRVVLNNLFGMEMPLLEDRAFFSSGDLNFEDVTERLDP